ncbi:MAG TPA: TolC family protein, partial [Bryobacteraceae bacterium]|nr:TolC family protein [Bryobacteraceae bacterium]
MRLRKIFAAATVWICVAGQVWAEQPFVSRPQGSPVWRSYKPPAIPPVQLFNSDRLHRLIRAGKLYLTLQDAIALAIENNLDLAVDRYGPLGAEWNLEREQAGGPLRGVTNGNSFVNQIAAGQGVAGALQSAGLNSGGGGGGGGNSNALIAQIGPVTPNLDPVFQNSSAWSHITTPQAVQTISQTDALVDTAHRFGSFVQEGLLSGGYVQFAANESYLSENSPTDVLNPSFAPVVQFYLQHNLLGGFGTGVNSRFIHVAQNQVTASSQTFRSQLINLVQSVANMYWDLVSDNDDLKARQNARDFAEKFYQDTQYEARIGAIAGFQVVRAQEEYSTRTQDVQIAQTAVRQQEVR